MTDPAAVADDTVLITRVFEAPRDEVFAAWTEPERIATWFGPDTVDTPRVSIRVDLRIGGRWEATMVAHDGNREMTIGYEIVELVVPELLVMRSDPMPEMGMPKPTTVRVELHDHGEKTRMTLTDGPLPASFRDAAEGGWGSSLSRLAAHLAG